MGPWIHGPRPSARSWCCGSPADGRQGLLLAREDSGLVLAGEEDWSTVPVPALVHGLAPRWTAMVRPAVAPHVEQDPDSGESWATGGDGRLLRPRGCQGGIEPVELVTLEI